MGNASRLAIGMVELNSIARGIETCDYMVKAAQVDLIRSSTVCPGKYMVLIAGDTGDVKAAMAEGIKRGGECVVDTLTLPNVHPQVIQAISMTTQVEKPGAVGVLEFYMAEGIKRGGECVVDTLTLPNVHPQVIQAISMTTQVEKPGAVGVLEFYSVASAIIAADVAAKAANITLIEVRIGYAIGGKGYVTLTGDVGAVRAAVAAAEREAELLVGTTVIPRPSPKLFQSLL